MNSVPIAKGIIDIKYSKSSLDASTLVSSLATSSSGRLLKISINFKDS